MSAGYRQQYNICLILFLSFVEVFIADLLFVLVGESGNYFDLGRIPSLLNFTAD